MVAEILLSGNQTALIDSRSHFEKKVKSSMDAFQNVHLTSRSHWRNDVYIKRHTQVRLLVILRI